MWTNMWWLVNTRQMFTPSRLVLIWPFDAALGSKWAVQFFGQAPNLRVLPGKQRLGRETVYCDFMGRCILSTSLQVRIRFQTTLRALTQVGLVDLIQYALLTLGKLNLQIELKQVACPNPASFTISSTFETRVMNLYSFYCSRYVFFVFNIEAQWHEYHYRTLSSVRKNKNFLIQGKA